MVDCESQLRDYQSGMEGAIVICGREIEEFVTAETRSCRQIGRLTFELGEALHEKQVALCKEVAKLRCGLGVPERCNSLPHA